MVLTYMARMLQEAKSKGLSLRREAFQESGRRVTLYKGVREWFERINAYGAARGIRILHYINSSGMKEIIEGTEIAHEFRKYTPARFSTTWTASPTGPPWRSTTPTRRSSSSR